MRPEVVDGRVVVSRSDGFGVLVVEDHDGMRAALAEAVTRLARFHLVDSVGHAEAALGAIPSSRPDLALIDLSLPGMSGTELVAVIRGQWPDVRCIIVSGHREAHYVEESERAGAKGYVVKGRPSDIAESLESVAAGGTYYSASLGR